MSNVHKRGFASMDPKRRKAIASMGGKSVPAEKRSFYKDRDLSRASGSKGGKVSKPRAK